MQIKAVDIGTFSFVHELNTAKKIKVIPKNLNLSPFILLFDDKRFKSEP